MKVGVIGSGYWGKKVISEYIRLKEEDIIDEVLVFDKNLNSIPKSNNIVVKTSKDSIIKEADAIHICSPNSSHYEIAKAAINLGKHVLIEKPMTLNLIESNELVLLAKEKRLVLRVGHIFRFSNNINMLRSIISSGILGKIQYSLITWGHLFPSSSTTDAGVLWDILPHPLDILLFTTNESPIVIEKLNSSKNMEMDNKFSMVRAIFKSGHVSFIFVSGIHPIKTRKIEIVGTNGSLSTEALSNTIEFRSSKSSDENKIYYVEINNTILDEISEFINDIKKGQEDSINSGLVGRDVVGLLERVTD